MKTMSGSPCPHHDCSNRNSFGYCQTTVCINEHYQQEQFYSTNRTNTAIGGEKRTMLLIKGMSKKDFEEILKYARYGANNCMIGERAEVVELPPHGDLIDADKLVELCDIMADKCDGIGVSIWHQFKTMVEWSPIVIPEEEGE